MAVRPIDLAFMNDINRARTGMPFSPRATYGSTQPIATDPLRITINPNSVLPKPQLVQPNVAPQNTNAFSGLLGNNFADPKTMGLLGASAELLKAGGYSVGKPAPTMGEALGNAMTTGMANYLAVQQAQNKANAPISVGKDTMLITRDGKVLMDNRSNEPFKGSGMTNQAFNTILSLNDKMKDGTATVPEQQKFSLARGYLSKPIIETISMPDGTQKQVQRPAQDLSMFFNPNPEQQSGGSKVVGEKPSELQLKFQEKKPKLFTMLGNLNKYKQLLNKIDFKTQVRGSVKFPTAKATELTTLAEQLRLNIKDLEDLGALVGGDFQILANRLTSPNTIEGIGMGKDGLLIQLRALENQILNDLQAGGFKDPTGALSDPIQVRDPKDWENGRFGLYYKLPDNSIVYKERKLK